MAVTTTLSQLLLKSELGTNTFKVNNQLAPDTLGLSNGGFVTAYNNREPNNGFILLDFYDAGFGVVSGSFRIPYADGAKTTAIGEPSLTQLANGNVLVVWDENNDADSAAGMKAALFSESGATLDTNIDLSSGGIAFRDIDVTALSNGNFAVSFAFGSFEMFRLYTADGTAIGGAHIMNQVTAGTQSDAQLTALAGGGFVAVWTDVNTRQVQARIFEDDGEARTDEFPVAFFPGKSQAAVAALPNGNWALVYRDTAWSEPGTDGAGITLQVFMPDGGDFGLVQVTDFSAPDESDPDVTVLANGFVLVTWSRPTSATNTDIIGRLFDQQGSPVEIAGDDREFVITSSASDDTLPSVSALLAGQYITSWQDSFTGDGSGGRITSEISEFLRTSVGDGAADTIVGDELRDLMDGGDGSDTLHGDGADDTLKGGRGGDSLDGGDGDDLLEGGARDDVIHGRAGDDAIYAATRTAPAAADPGATMDGGEGDDLVVGGLGADVLAGGAGQDTLLGGGGADDVIGGSGVDLLSGEAGNDVLAGDEDNDTLNGGNDDDTLLGGSGADVLNGGDGGDVIVSGAGADTIEGGLGLDTLSYRANFTPIRVDLVAGVGFGGNAEGDVFSGIEALDGSLGDDTIVGSTRSETLNGSFGDDVIESGGGDDTVLGASGDDQIFAVARGHTGLGGQATFDGEDGADTVTGCLDDETLRGGDGDDLLFSGGGLDLLEGGAGNDTMPGGFNGGSAFGGSGNDTVVVTRGPAGAPPQGAVGPLAPLPARQFISGDGGVDTIDASGSAAFDARYDLAGKILSSGGVTVTLKSMENVKASGGSDTIIGTNGSNVLDGGGGRDAISGGEGADTLFGGAAGDTLTGGLGGDRFSYRSVTDSPGAFRSRTDEVSDFSRNQGDKIDLSGIDAIAGGADDAFVVVDFFSFTAGELIVSSIGNDQFLIQGDVDGDASRDFDVVVSAEAGTFNDLDLVL